MKSKELAEQLLKYPNFEVVFRYSEQDGSPYGISVITFNNIEIGDIGHSDKCIVLLGDKE